MHLGKKLRMIGLGAAALLLAVSGICSAGSAGKDEVPEGWTRLPSGQARQTLSIARNDKGGAPARDLLRDIRIPRKTTAVFNNLYSRHGREIQKIIDKNPEMIWPAIDIFLDALPGLRSIPQNGGKLIVDRRTYGKASQLWDQYAGHASPALAEDLKKTKDYLEKRMTKAEANQVAIDLN